MIETVAALARWFQLAANMTLVGGCIFLVIAGWNKAALPNLWITRLERSLPWLATALLLGLLVVLATTTAQATGIAENVWQPGAWFGILLETRMGHIWAARAALGLTVLGIAFYVRNSPGIQGLLLCATVAAFTLAAGSLASHSAAEELSLISILPYTLHIILASIWFGALPAFLLVLFFNKGQQKNAIVDQSDVQTLKRFSILALPVMLGIIATGIFVANRMIDTSYSALFATKYGWLLNAKIFLLIIVLMIAARARSVWLPSLTQDQNLVAAGSQKMRKWVRIEFVLALTIVLLATILANSVPAKHAIIQDWPYPFRFSIAATWDDPTVVMRVWGGIILLILAGGIVVYSQIKKWTMKHRVGISALLAICALFLALPSLAIQAYSETYRKTPVPFDAISIANGSGLFAKNCVTCHGFQGKGNGILAKSFTKPPVDMLTEPHTAKHTAGDFFNWLTYGIPGTGMPDFANKLEEEERWDVINYLHAMSRGYQARLMNPNIVPNQPSLGPPGFSYSAHDGSSGILKDFRQKKTVLLVLFSWPDSRARLDQLRRSYGALSAGNTTILAVPMNDLDLEDMATITADSPFPIVTEGAPEITRSYALFRRTLSKPDLLGEGSLPKHMELLVDRYGYLRARWIPEADGDNWINIDTMAEQIARLSREKEILPPPGDHVH
ncbi:MAG: CopD family protein [Nitrosospira sp.]|nr:CopD family protein [Nitrosospira sp.]MBI0415365.1 CopD family protein [Nitrosospira sp.]MBI0417475.1 CopD family protein [Nitrosospira sp.]MBI0417664.1 CopD family protein [Nitrosospira sp.]MBI0419062.1 CopD family protein [Nitrosospira sp.]